MSGMLHWLERQQLLLVNLLKHVEKVSKARRSEHRRALSLAEVARLLAVAPASRSWVYLVILYTGLRRHELNRITWGDFDLDSITPSVRLAAADTKNGEPARVRLRPEIVDALTRHRPVDAMSFEWVFRGTVPAPAKLRKDIHAAGIPAVDDRGRCVDVHALRTTYGTMLSSSGISPRMAMELMRHSDLRLTMKIYTDAAQLPLSSEMDKLRSFSLPIIDARIDAQNSAQTRASGCHDVSLPVTVVETLAPRQVADIGLFGPAKSSSITPIENAEMVGAARFELATSTSRT